MFFFSHLVLTELHKHLFGFIKSHLLKVLAHKDFNRVFVPVIWDLVTHQVWLKEAVKHRGEFGARARTDSGSQIKRTAPSFMTKEPQSNSQM